MPKPRYLLGDACWFHAEVIEGEGYLEREASVHRLEPGPRGALRDPGEWPWTWSSFGLFEEG